nr:MAG TPA: hypothetical protein [Caudoviricetes sp.]
MNSERYAPPRMIGEVVYPYYLRQKRNEKIYKM